HLVQTIIGDGKIGSELIQQKPDKIFFTGSVATGRKILSAAAHHLTPVNLELGGKDAMIVCEDADLDLATSGALWGGYSNAGQICASVERILVHASIRKEFVETLKNKIRRLNQGDPSQPNIDVGAITMEKQKEIYSAQLTDAERRGLKFETGGKFSSDRRFLEPTLVTGDEIESSEIYQEETFGPVIALTTFETDNEAIEKSNLSPYGLLGSVFSQNLKRAEAIAQRLEVGTVTINEVVYTAGLPETPWGGRKDSGYGKKHSAEGLLEFVHVKHIHAPRSTALQFKSLWWFPYGKKQAAFFDSLFLIYKRDRLAKIAALPRVFRALIDTCGHSVLLILNLTSRRVIALTGRRCVQISLIQPPLFEKAFLVLRLG
ncbi:MAG: aldehyde dehydrogenase family protein, partial [Proteobacteria bacterium]